MRRLLPSLGAAAVLAVTSNALAQDLQPPPPMQQPAQPGLAPPPPMQQPLGQPQPNNEQLQKQETAKKLDEAESEDSHRSFELFWIDGSIGGSYIDMAQFSSSDLAVKKTSAGGPAFSLGAGIRLLVFYAGARLRYNALSLFNLWQINGELGIKVPISSIDFMAGLHGGYSFVGRLGDANQATDTSTPASNDAVSVRGFNVGLDVALDYYVSSLFSVGFGVLGDALILNRPPVDLPSGLTAEQQAAAKDDPLYQKSGTSAGLGLAGMLRLGLHFGL
jgi:hypothetical protein